MSKNKLQKFADLYLLPNVYQNQSPNEPALLNPAQKIVDMRGKWHETHFQNTNPITLELACGKAEYTLSLGQAYPNRNFIAIDLKGNRLWNGASMAHKQGLKNIAFIRSRIELVDSFFAENEVKEIWITFPDPFLRESKSLRRLTSERFLEKYKCILKKEGMLHLKTDDDVLYQFTLDTIEEQNCRLIYANEDIYASELVFPELEYKTYYEKLHLEKNKKIKYIRFQLGY